VYENIAGTWEQIGDDIDGETAEDNSGFSVAISNDGSIVAIGAPFNDGTASDAGQVRVYENQSGAWEQLGDDIDGEAMNDRFGTSVELSADGTIVAIGARDNNSRGHVRVLENQSGNWVQIGDDIDGESIGDKFGDSVDISSDGTIVAIGAPFSDGAGLEQGRVQIYQNQSNNWVQIDNNIEGEDMNDRSGVSVALSADGSIAAIGAHLNDGNGANAGHARTFTNSNILDVQSSEVRSNFLAYPNPASTHFTLNLRRVYPTIDIEIYDALGRQIQSQSYANTDTIEVSTLNFAKGVYYVNINASEDEHATIKILKE
jgi:hypothetical protein